jgi:hypothetical protein
LEKRSWGPQFIVSGPQDFLQPLLFSSGPRRLSHPCLGHFSGVCPSLQPLSHQCPSPRATILQSCCAQETVKNLLSAQALPLSWCHQEREPPVSPRERELPENSKMKQIAENPIFTVLSRSHGRGEQAAISAGIFSNAPHWGRASGGHQEEDGEQEAEGSDRGKAE